MFYKKVYVEKLSKTQRDIGEVDRVLEIFYKLRSGEILK